MERLPRSSAGGSAANSSPLVAPIFTPPWNRCTDVTAGCLAELGFACLSREARAEPLRAAALVELPIDVDWFASRRGRRLDYSAVAEQLAARLRVGGPVGVMLHHAQMEPADFQAAPELLTLIPGHERARCAPMAHVAALA